MLVNAAAVVAAVVGLIGLLAKLLGDRSRIRRLERLASIGEKLPADSNALRDVRILQDRAAHDLLIEEVGEIVIAYSSGSRPGLTLFGGVASLGVAALLLAPTFLPKYAGVLDGTTVPLLISGAVWVLLGGLMVAAGIVERRRKSRRQADAVSGA